MTVTWNVTPGPDVDNGATSAIANLATTTITCTDNGTYTITATASDGNATATARTELTIANADPVITITSAPTGALP